MSRKELKNRGKHNLRQHYLMFVLLCIVAAVLGTKLSSSLSFISSNIDTFIIGETWLEAKDDNAQLRTNPFAVDNTDLSDVLSEFIAGNITAADELAKQNHENNKEMVRQFGVDSIQLSRGVLATVVNRLTSGEVYITILKFILKFTHSESIAFIIFGSLVLVISVLFWALFKKTYAVVMARSMLEGRIYEHVPFQRLVFLRRVRKWLKASWAIVVQQIFLILWSLTVIGGIIKRYSYYLVPYIVAENPSIGALKALRLSKKMMKGHKWELFVFELSFIPWQLLGIITFGIAEILYVFPYVETSLCEYYVSRREDILKRDDVPEIKYLNDTFLYEKPSQQLLNEAYSESIEELEAIEEHPDLKGVKGFLIRNLAISTGTKAEREYEEYQSHKMRMYKYHLVVDGLIYPGRLNPLHEDIKHSRLEVLNYARAYTPERLIMLFFIFMFTGWTWEVLQGYAEFGVFINRGFLHGPWLPIYGAGGMTMICLFHRLKKEPGVFFVVVMAFSGVIEYLTSYIMEKTTGLKWWDYSGYFLNINGRICMEGLLAFGVIGMIVIYFITPIIDNFIKKIPRKLSYIICTILLALWIGDIAYSAFVPNMGEGVTGDMPS